MGSEKNGGDTKEMNQDKNKDMHNTTKKQLIGGYLVGGIIGFVTIVLILGVYWSK